VLVCTVHHIVADGWSVGIVVHELSAIYEAMLRSDPPLWSPDYPICDYAWWQRQWLVSEVLESQQAYWKTTLAETPPALDLPTDHPKPAVHSTRVHRKPFGYHVICLKRYRSRGGKKACQRLC